MASSSFLCNGYYSRPAAVIVMAFGHFKSPTAVLSASGTCLGRTGAGAKKAEMPNRYHHFIERRPCGGAHSPVNSNPKMLACHFITPMSAFTWATFPTPCTRCRKTSRGATYTVSQLFGRSPHEKQHINLERKPKYD